jgi:transcriptional regulator with XRE-family HTH domain
MIIRQELVRALRGRISQERLSARLGFRSNQLHRWEAGTGSLDWIQFTRLCEACKRNLPKTVHYVLGFGGNLKDAPGLIRHLAGTEKVSEIARKTGFSRFVVSKWLSGKSIPPLDVILEMMESLQFILVEFVGDLVPIESVPSLREVASQLQKQKDLFYTHPEAEAVICTLALAQYQALPRHKPGMIADWIGITREQEAFAISALEKVGLISERLGKFEVKTTQVDTQGNFFQALKIRRHWAKQYEKFINLCKPPEGPRSKTGYFLIDLSEVGEKKVHAAYLEYCFKLRAIAQSDFGAKKTVKLCNAQIIDLLQLGELLKG